MYNRLEYRKDLGNRMRILANYTGINGETTPYTQDFWYNYDSRNRMIIAKGSLDASQGVVHGSTGYRLYYNSRPAQPGDLSKLQRTIPVHGR